MPSPTVRVTGTTPAAEQVKVLLAAPGAENAPLGADHAYVRPPRFGPLATALNATLPPTVVSAGFSVAVVIDAQLYVGAATLAVPASESALLHWRRSVTFVVARTPTENLVEPEQVTVPSVDVPVIEIV